MIFISYIVEIGPGGEPDEIRSDEPRLIKSAIMTETMPVMMSKLIRALARSLYDGLYLSSVKFSSSFFISSSVMSFF